MRIFGVDIFQSGGTYSSLPSVPKNEIILFEKDTVVLGYTLLTDIDDEVIYVTKGTAAGSIYPGGSTRGSWTLSTSNHTHGLASHVHTIQGHVLSLAEIPSHTHSYTDYYDYYGPVHMADDSGAAYATSRSGTTGAAGSSGSHTHGCDAATGTTASGGGENLTAWRPLGRCFTRQRRA